jgi:hypothetical protein
VVVEEGERAPDEANDGVGAFVAMELGVGEPGGVVGPPPVARTVVG